MTYNLDAKRRRELIEALRAVAKRWYNGDPPIGPYEDYGQFEFGICRAVAAEIETSETCDGGGGYALVDHGLKDIGYPDGYAPFRHELHGGSGDWTVRPLFCLLFADILESQDAPA